MLGAEKLLQRGLPAAVPGGPADQAAATGLHHPHTPLDIRTVFQGRQASHKSFQGFIDLEYECSWSESLEAKRP